MSLHVRACVSPAQRREKKNGKRTHNIANHIRIFFKQKDRAERKVIRNGAPEQSSADKKRKRKMWFVYVNLEIILCGK